MFGDNNPFLDSLDASNVHFLFPSFKTKSSSSILESSILPKTKNKQNNYYLDKLDSDQ